MPQLMGRFKRPAILPHCFSKSRSILRPLALQQWPRQSHWPRTVSRWPFCRPCQNHRCCPEPGSGYKSCSNRRFTSHVHRLFPRSPLRLGFPATLQRSCSVMRQVPIPARCSTVWLRMLIAHGYSDRSPSTQLPTVARLARPVFHSQKRRRI